MPDEEGVGQTIGVGDGLGVAVAVGRTEGEGVGVGVAKPGSLHWDVGGTQDVTWHDRPWLVQQLSLPGIGMKLHPWDSVKQGNGVGVGEEVDAGVGDGDSEMLVHKYNGQGVPEPQGFCDKKGVQVWPEGHVCPFPHWVQLVSGGVHVIPLVPNPGVKLHCAPWGHKYAPLGGQ